MVLVDNIEVRTDETHVCLPDLLKLARCSIRSSNYKTILREVKRNRSESKLVNKEVWVTYDFASRIFMGYECSRLINDLPKATADPTLKLARPARRTGSESKRLMQQEIEANILKKSSDTQYRAESQTKRRKLESPEPALVEPEPVPEPVPELNEDHIDLTDDDTDREPEPEPVTSFSLQDAKDRIMENPGDLKLWQEYLEMWPDYQSRKGLYWARVGADFKYLGEFIKFEYSHNNYTATIKLLEEMSAKTPNDPTMWLFIADICLVHNIEGHDSLLKQGLKYMANGNYCKQRVPFILKAAAYLRRKHESTFTVLVIVSQVMKRADNWTTDEINSLQKLIRCLFELAQTQYEPGYPSQLNSIEMLPDLEKPFGAQRLVAKYMEKSENASNTEKWLFYMNILDGLMNRYFVKPPPINSVQETWSGYLAVWVNYANALRRHQIDPSRIYDLFEQIYKQVPQFARDQAVVDYSQILFDAGLVDDALNLLSEWVQVGKEYTRGFRKEVLRFQFCILIDAYRMKDRFTVLIPYLVRFQNDGQIWESIIRFEYHAGEPSIARNLAELALQVLEGSSRECIWTCYLKCDKGLDTEMYENILARYFQEFKTTESIKLLAEFYKETLGEAMGKKISEEGIQYQNRLGRQLAVDDHMRLL